MVLGRKTNFSPREKMVLGKNTNFFLGETKTTIILDFGRVVAQKMIFFGFLQEKVGFPVQNHLFPTSFS